MLSPTRVPTQLRRAAARFDYTVGQPDDGYGEGISPVRVKK
jgi:hypothetical protein